MSSPFSKASNNVKFKQDYSVNQMHEKPSAKLYTKTTNINLHQVNNENNLQPIQNQNNNNKQNINVYNHKNKSTIVIQHYQNYKPISQNHIHSIEPCIRSSNYVKEVKELNNYNQELIKEKNLASTHLNHKSPIPKELDVKTLDIKNGQDVKKVLDSEGFEVDEKIGEGSFGSVFKVKFKKGKKICVMKIVYLDMSTSEGIEIYKLTLLEVKILYEIKHKNIIRLHLFKEFSNGLLEIMEFAEKGDLLKVIEGKSLSKEVVFAIFKEILEGVKELHKNKINHRDLKIENILLNEKYEIKICDFGLAKVNKFDDNKTIIGQYESLGSPQTIAPEALGKKVGPSSSVDIWALGCILYFLIYGYYPFQIFPANNLEEHKMNILNKDIQLEKNHPWFNVNKENDLVDLLKRFFIKDPKNRIKLNEIENSNWYKAQIIHWKKDHINEIENQPMSLKHTKKISNNLNVNSQ